MSGLHLNHKLPWSSLKDLYLIYKDHGVELPTGACGLVHITNKEQKLQVAHRNYIGDKDICTNPSCEPKGSKVFRKPCEKKYSLETRLNREGKEYLAFLDAFKKAIREFAETERAKIGPGRPQTKTAQAIKDHLVSNSQWPQTDSYDYSYCWCRLVTILIELGDVQNLLALSTKDITSVLRCLHGGQAVGNNITFLTYHVVNVYVLTNLIFALNLQDSPEKWGRMKPVSPQGYGFRGELTYDCDGQTFLHFSRKYLTDEAYMKDFDGMRELCKNCFRFLYFVEMLWMELEDRSGSGISADSGQFSSPTWCLDCW